jgi:hypothetical protein
MEKQAIIQYKMGYRTLLLKKDVSYKTFWQTIRNVSMILRLKKAKKIHFSFSMPYGGRYKSLTYNLSQVTFTKPRTNDTPNRQRACAEKNR